MNNAIIIYIKIMNKKVSFALNKSTPYELMNLKLKSDMVQFHLILNKTLLTSRQEMRVKGSFNSKI